MGSIMNFLVLSLAALLVVDARTVKLPHAHAKAPHAKVPHAHAHSGPIHIDIDISAKKPAVEEPTIELIGACTSVDFTITVDDDSTQEISWEVVKYLEESGTETLIANGDFLSEVAGTYELIENGNVEGASLLEEGIYTVDITRSPPPPPPPTTRRRYNSSSLEASLLPTSTATFTGTLRVGGTTSGVAGFDGLAQVDSPAFDTTIGTSFYCASCQPNSFFNPFLCFLIGTKFLEEVSADEATTKALEQAVGLLRSHVSEEDLEKLNRQRDSTLDRLELELTKLGLSLCEWSLEFTSCILCSVTKWLDEFGVEAAEQLEAAAIAIQLANRESCIAALNKIDDSG